MNMMNYGYGTMGFGWIGMLIVPLLLIGFIAYAAANIANGSRRRQDGRYDESGHAMEILKQKLASGEISEEEYNRKKDLLR